MTVLVRRETEINSTVNLIVVLWWGTGPNHATSLRDRAQLRYPKGRLNFIVLLGRDDSTLLV